MLKDALLITLADSSCPVHNALMLHKAQALYKAVFAKEPCCRFRRLISKPLLMWGVGFIKAIKRRQKKMRRRLLNEARAAVRDNRAAHYFNWSLLAATS